ncbi:hypothetical protein ACIQ7Q_27700 [Streptomyces sp. NPDC096176]|uniref:hypothetical protein n=1 Tax=Streptomyces sp. NPDC096176 TaxID=3366079 RepID=UPI0037FDF872
MSEQDRSRTAEMRDVIKRTIESGFTPQVIHRQTRDTDNVQTYLFTLLRLAAA